MILKCFGAIQSKEKIGKGYLCLKEENRKFT
jgi:hypothetical protein